MRVGIWGAGSMGGKHAASIAASGRATVAAVCSRNQERAEALLAEHGADGAVYVDDIDRMLDDCGLDALVIATPPGARGDVAQRAARAGLHLLLEKPIALDPATVDDIAAACAGAGVCCQVVHHFRCHPAVVKLKAMIDSGEAGRCCQFQSRFWMNGDMSDWWKDPSCSGGQVVEQLIHCYDMALHLFGPVARVAGLRACLCKDAADAGYLVDDNSIGLLQFASGALGDVSGSNTAVPERFIGDWRVICERLTADFTGDGDWRTPDQAVFQLVGDRGGISDRIPQDIDLHAAICDNWLDACLAGAALISPITDAVDTHRLVFRMVESMLDDGAWKQVGSLAPGAAL